MPRSAQIVDSFGCGIEGALRRKGADVQLIDHRIGQRRRLPAIIAPCKPAVIEQAGEPMHTVRLPRAARIGIGMRIVIEKKCVAASVPGGFDLGMPPAALAGLHRIYDACLLTATALGRGAQTENDASAVPLRRQQTTPESAGLWGSRAAASPLRRPRWSGRRAVPPFARGQGDRGIAPPRPSITLSRGTTVMTVSPRRYAITWPRFVPTASMRVGALRRTTPHAGGGTVRVVDRPQLGQAFVDPRHHLRGGQVLHLVQQPAAQLVVHRPAIVRVDQAQVPQLRALVEIGHAGRGMLQQGLRQRVDSARAGSARRTVPAVEERRRSRVPVMNRCSASSNSVEVRPAGRCFASRTAFSM